MLLRMFVCVSLCSCMLSLSLSLCLSFSLSSTLVPVSPYSAYWVLSTDYATEVVVYSCTDILRLFHVEFAWILGRSRNLTVATMDHARQLLQQENIDITYLKATDQSGCQDV